MEANTFDFEAHLRKVREQTQGVTEVTEDRIALAFAERYGDQFRYYHHHGSWFVWNGQWWAKEETKLAFHYAREIAREHNIMNKASIAKTSTAAGVERHAQADRAFAVTSEKWDRDPFLLGTQVGTVDLRSGKLRPARQEDYITKTTAVSPAPPDTEPALWLRFLQDATGGDAGLMRFL